MRPEEVERLLGEVAEGRIAIADALAALRYLPTDDIDFARLDLHRELRQGMPEVIYAESKTDEQIVAIAGRLLDKTTSPVLATRVSPSAAGALQQAFPDAVHHEAARVVTLRSNEEAGPSGLMAVVTAGTSDLPVAEEAAVVAEAMGIKVERVTDVGVAGLHRVLGAQKTLEEADVVVCVAGMEGALPSIVGGLTSSPVVAVPTSVGYGSNFEGLSALLGMLNSCAAGLVVTNIDNGFGAAMFAVRLLRKKSS